MSSGCIRLINQDVSDLYSRVNVGTKMIVLPMDRRADNAAGKRSWRTTLLRAHFMQQQPHTFQPK